MQSAAILWHVNQLNPNPIALGAVGLARVFPVLAFSLVAGVAADSYNRRRLMFVTQAVLARELGLPTEELLRDNDNSLLFCYRQLIQNGRVEYEARQAAWAKRWEWPDATHAAWMTGSK